MTAPTTPGGTPGSDGEIPSYPIMTDEEYASQEMEKLSAELIAAIDRIRTLPVSKHEVVNSEDLGPDLSLSITNVNRVNAIFLSKYTELSAAQTNAKITDFDTSGLGALSDFRKSVLAWQWLFPMANGHIKQFPSS